MPDISTKYLGLDLRSPIIAGSCGYTSNTEDIKKLDEVGVGAVVLKSLFEEEIINEMLRVKTQMQKPGTLYPEIFDFFDFDDMEDSVSKYLFMIEELKKSVKIPIIPSVNCVSSNEWPVFAKRLENAGADALELNLFILPSDMTRSSEENEKVYFDVIKKVKEEINIPVALKISYYFSNLASFIKKLSESGIDGLVLFNRFYSPDIDVDNLKVIPADVTSHPSDIFISLRWIAIMAGRVSCDLASSTGVHDGYGAVKQLLAGANAVQVASALYKNGIDYIGELNHIIERWMNEHNFKSIDEFRGKLSYINIDNPAAYERVQFMRYFSGMSCSSI